MTETQTPGSTTSTPDTDEISLLDLLQTIAENWKLLFWGPVVAGLVALGAAVLMPATYTATTKFLPPQQQQSAAASMLAGLGALGGLAGAAAGLKSPADQYVAFLKSRNVADALIDRFDLQNRYEQPFRDDTVKMLFSQARISAGKDGLITVDVDDRDPAFAAQLANAFVQELERLLDTLAVTEAQQRRQFFEKQLSQTQGALTKAEQALQQAGINRDAFKNSPQAAVEAVARVQAQVAALEVKVASLRGYLTESAPEFKQALTELSALRAQLNKLESSTGPAPATTDYVARFREFKYQETLFELFAKQFELAKLDESREGAVIQVLDQAKTPDRTSKPKKALIAVIAALATGFFLLLWVFVRQALRNASQDQAVAVKLQAIRSSFGFKG